VCEVDSVRIAKSEKVENFGKLVLMEKAKDEQYCCHR
jgi:hypothetical protein